MRLLLVAIGIAALAVVGWVCERATRDSREWHELLSWEGKDLLTLEEKQWQRVDELYRRRVRGGATSTRGLRRVFILQNPDGARRVLFFHSTWQTMGLVSNYVVEVDVFDGHRNLLDRNTLWRNEPYSNPNLQPYADAGIPWCFGPMVAQPDPDSRDFYALVHEQPVLIRVVSDQGTFCRIWYGQEGCTWYGARGASAAPQVPDRTPEQWEDSLRSTKPAEILWALVWLSGQHADDDPFRGCWLDTLARPGVQRRLSELRLHAHPWVAEAARMVK